MMLGDFILKVRRFGIENMFKRYYSIYPGIVTSNKDDKKRGRIKIKVPDILGNIELSNMAEPMLLTAGKNYGIFYPPKVNDYVWVQFRMGDISAPIYSGGWWGKDERPDILSDDNKNAIFISRYGHRIIVDEDEENCNFNITMGEDLSLEINSGKKMMKLCDKENNGFIIDIANGQWDIKFNGTLNEVIEREVNKTFNDKLVVSIAKNGEINCSMGLKFNSDDNIALTGPKINLGSNSPSSKAVLGNSFLQALNSFITAYNSHTHPTTSPGSPTLAPMVPGQEIPDDVLSQKVKLD